MKFVLRPTKYMKLPAICHKLANMIMSFVLFVLDKKRKSFFIIKNIFLLDLEESFYLSDHLPMIGLEKRLAKLYADKQRPRSN